MASEYAESVVRELTITAHRWGKLPAGTRRRVMGAMGLRRSAILGMSIGEVEDALRAVDEYDGQAGDWLADEVMEVGYATCRFRADEAEYL